MKNQVIQYLAFDVHQATVVATARDEHGSIRMRATVPIEASAIVGLVRSLGRVHVAFEEGTQAQWMHDLLEPEERSMWWFATYGVGARRATRAIGSTRTGCP